MHRVDRSLIYTHQVAHQSGLICYQITVQEVQQRSADHLALLIFLSCF